jgi:hypothetical protein
VNQNESIHLSLGNQPCANRRFPKRGGSTKDAFVMIDDLGNGLLLERS